MRIAVGDAALAALLIVQDEAHGEARAPRPVGLWTVSAISHKVTKGKIVH
jgi:type IV secretory pathway protease TraF